LSRGVPQTVRKAVQIALVPLLLVLAASIFSSGFDVTRKLLGQDLAPLPMVVLLAAGSVPLFALAVWLQGGSPLDASYFAPALGSVVLNLGANLAFLQSVRLAPLSTTVPLLSLTPAFTTIVGVLLLGEVPGARAWVGVVLVTAGAWWLSSGPSTPPAGGGAGGAGGRTEDGGRTGDGNQARLPRSGGRRGSRGTWLMAAAAGLWSVTIPLDKLAVHRASPPAHGLFLTAGIGIGAAGALAGQRRLRELAGIRRVWPMYGLALLTSTLTLGCQLLALKVVLVSVVETVKRGIGNLAAIALGRAVFAETVGWRQLVAATLMAGGVALILL
jgi:drug/metabolite transporter (DMT)-like permease